MKAPRCDTCKFYEQNKWQGEEGLCLNPLKIIHNNDHWDEETRGVSVQGEAWCTEHDTDRTVP